ncbi:hypothetical protein CRG98_002925 [Punica granatum]|uniref:Uncharacterized protein n=1 Tax=Punica granatum TaxID=22663 RepID=A0A2I0L914_PUNGR|nr:hypothetical protein CRG98_002925 [Punica granatum]
MVMYCSGWEAPPWPEPRGGVWYGMRISSGQIAWEGLRRTAVGNYRLVGFLVGPGLSLDSQVTPYPSLLWACTVQVG